jgi:hypothetical protein
MDCDARGPGPRPAGSVGVRLEGPLRVLRFYGCVEFDWPFALEKDYKKRLAPLAIQHGLERRGLFANARAWNYRND